MAERWQLVAWVLAGLVFVYLSFFQHLLDGVLVGALVYLFVWWLAVFGLSDTDGAFSARRTGATTTIIVLVMAYAVFLAADAIAGVLAAGTVFVVAWVTSPTGPFGDN